MSAKCTREYGRRYNDGGEDNEVSSSKSGSPAKRNGSSGGEGNGSSEEVVEEGSPRVEPSFHLFSFAREKQSFEFGLLRGVRGKKGGLLHG